MLLTTLLYPVTARGGHTKGCMSEQTIEYVAFWQFFHWKKRHYDDKKLMISGRLARLFPFAAQSAPAKGDRELQLSGIGAHDNDSDKVRRRSAPQVISVGF
jgi:hypothetical protein